MSRKIDEGFVALEKAGVLAQEKLEKEIIELGYYKRSKEEILVELLEVAKKKAMKPPKRTNYENSIQDQYLYCGKTGYEAVIHTGILGEEFSDYGYAWSVIRDEQKKGVWFRPSGHDTKVGVLKRLLIFAKFIKNVVDLRPIGFELVELKEESEGDFVWRSAAMGDIPFFAYNYMHGMNKEEKRFIHKSLSATRKHLKQSAEKAKAEGKKPVRRHNLRAKNGLWFN